MTKIPSSVASGLQSLEKLNAARSLLEEFADKSVDALDPRHRDLLNEGRFRTQQMARLLEIVIELMGRAKPGSIDAEYMLDLQTMTESFYYFAHRALKALKHHPKLQRLKANGIAIVRNQLMDHADGAASGVLDVTFLCSPESGPVVKGIRAAANSYRHRDAGLWANVDEFSDALSSLLKPST